MNPLKNPGKFLVLVRSDSPDAQGLAEFVANFLSDLGHEVRVEVHGDVKPDVGNPARHASYVDDCALVISMGGDGTMLRAVELATISEVPVLGVNLGHLGYLAHIEPDALEESLKRFIAGDYQVESRMTLSVSVAQDGASYQELFQAALNEAVIERSLAGHTIGFEVSISGTPFSSFAADGIIIATATGSTGYNMSARGPILSPDLEAIVVTPISPHMLFDRSLVLSHGQDVEISMTGSRSGELVVDGIHLARLVPGSRLRCRPGKLPAKLVVFDDPNFHLILKNKFQLKDR